MDSKIFHTEVNPTLDELVERAKAYVASLSPDEYAAMIRRQAVSWAIGEAGFGSDADEAEYAAAVLSGDETAIAECKRKSDERLASLMFGPNPVYPATDVDRREPVAPRGGAGSEGIAALAIVNEAEAEMEEYKGWYQGHRRTQTRLLILIARLLITLLHRQ